MHSRFNCKGRTSSWLFTGQSPSGDCDDEFSRPSLGDVFVRQGLHMSMIPRQSEENLAQQSTPQMLSTYALLILEGIATRPALEELRGRRAQSSDALSETTASMARIEIITVETPIVSPSSIVPIPGFVPSIILPCVSTIVHVNVHWLRLGLKPITPVLKLWLCSPPIAIVLFSLSVVGGFVAGQIDLGHSRLSRCSTRSWRR